jgi:hypothetical protein
MCGIYVYLLQFFHFSHFEISIEIIRELKETKFLKLITLTILFQTE